MKKILMALTLVAVFVVGTAFVYADSPITDKFTNSGFGRMGWGHHHNYRAKDGEETVNEEVWQKHHQEGEKYIDQALEDGKITEEEAAEQWKNHHEEMEEYHDEYGYGGCHGRKGGRSHRRGYHGKSI